MASGRLIRWPNFLIAFAGLLNVAMLFVPLSYAANFRDQIYCKLFAFRIEIEHTLADNSKDLERYAFYESIWMILFLLSVLAVSGYIFYIAFYNSDESIKRRRLRFAMLGLLGQAVLAFVLAWQAWGYAGDAPSNALAWSLEREFWFQLYVLIFLLWSHAVIRRKESKALDPDETD